MTELLKRLNQDYVDQLNKASPEVQKDAMLAYRQMAMNLRKIPLNGNKMMNDKNRLVSRLSRKHIGRLCMYYYYPKTKDKLPYYDRFPMVMPLELYQDGFLGINFHYLPYKHRAILMDAINKKVLKNNQLDEKKKLLLSYSIMKRAVSVPQYIPCIKRYLYSHLKSRIYIVEPDSWNIVLFLPLERFEKATMQRVHIESLRKVRTYGTF